MTDGELGEGGVALADRLSFQLYAASRAMAGAYRRELRAFNLSFPQYLTLRAVWEGDGRTVSEICASLELDSGTLSPLLSRLEAAGLLQRERIGTDGRQVRIFCTDAGRELRARVEAIPSDIETATGISEEEFGQLCGLLGKLRSAVSGA
ncbi:MarR family winged helix-turn-helix transcriptional regulator [Leucobacter sp. BZR 635]